jgi:hypothetical protein
MQTTDILLTILIGLVGFIGKVFYDKLVQIDKDMKKALMDGVAFGRDIEDHERRIGTLEDEVFKD